MTDPEELRRAAEEILARREFQPPGESIVDRVLGWIGDRFGDLIARIVGALSFGSTSAVAWIVLAAVAVMLGFVAARALRPRGRGARSIASLPVADVTVHHDAAWWFAVAEDAARRGRHGDAVRAHYRAGMARLVDEGRLRDEPGAPAGAWRGRVRDPSPEELEAMDELTEAFELVWFGGVDADPAMAGRTASRARAVGRS